MLFEQKFGFSVVVFCSHAAISIWFLLFFRFFGSDFFLNGFPNPFTAHSRPSFLFELNFNFSLVVFLFTCGILRLFFFVFFLIFWSDFLKMVFSIHSILGLVFLLSQWKFIELYVRTCPAIFFYFVEFALPILPLFRHFAWNLFDFSRLVSLFSHSAQSPFKQQLLSKAIQNEESQCKKSKSEIETG